MKAKDILVFGSPKASCKNCRKLEAMVDEITANKPQLRVRKLTLDSREAQGLGVLLTPSIAVDGEIIVLGDIPEMEDLSLELLK